MMRMRSFFLRWYNSKNFNFISELSGVLVIVTLLLFCVLGYRDAIAYTVCSIMAVLLSLGHILFSICLLAKARENDIDKPVTAMRVIEDVLHLVFWNVMYVILTCGLIAGGIHCNIYQSIF